MSLATYKKKRQFNKTPEPVGGVSHRHKQLKFVVQKHRASQLHYDFRLEMKGVLKSWAVPKGPSLNPKDKRLAVMVEDHPYNYRKFEGTIPAGNYGAGEVIIWDEGYYEPREQSDDPEKTLLGQLYKGHITLMLHGQKLMGEFALIKKANSDDNIWLLIKKSDEYASNKDVTLQDQSVVSGQRIEQSLPGKVKPMLATLVDKPFDDDDWLYEVKWDGYRALLAKAGKNVDLYSRSGQNFAKKYQAVCQTARKISGDYLIDGEIIATDEEGKAHFEWLQNWGRQPKGSLQFMVFDLLWYNGRDLTDAPLIDRKAALKDMVRTAGVIRYSDHIVGQGAELFKLAQSKGLEGIMAKRCASTYQAGRRSRDWLKIKTHLRQEAVIGGFTEPKGSRKHIGALVLGVYEDDKLKYVGHTGGGIPMKSLSKLRQHLESMEVKQSSFANKFKPNAPVHWVRPELICEVSFSEWTAGGHMRQPIFIGLREDKPARAVHMEKPAASPSEPGKSGKTGNTGKEHELKLSHTDKVFWPKYGYTKGSLIDYYKSVAEVMLPYLSDRPHSLLRQPNGINGPAFFQKDVDHTPPDWVKTKPIYSESNQKDINYLVCDSVDSLLYMVQLGCIEINPWNSRTAALDKPDWVVMDLDPEDIGFDKVIQTALAVKTVCEQLDIPSYPKTSGKTGIHVYIPLGASYTYDQCRQFGQLLATLIHQRLPKITSLERSPKKRQQKIYIDYLQNRKGQTLAAPYSVRPTPDATVSTPLNWEEVNKKLSPSKFSIKNTLKRLDKVGDLWQPVIGPGIDLKAVLARME